MKVFRTEQIREIDAYTILHEPVASIDLMERAAGACTRWIAANIALSRGIVVCCGTGNNGGDGLAIARQLRARYYRVKVIIVSTGNTPSVDFSVNLERIRQIPDIEVIKVENEIALPVVPSGGLIVDAVFGTGLKRPVTGLPGAVIDWMNRSGAQIVSVDMPSGLFGEDNHGNDLQHVVKAHTTLTFQFPKQSFFFAPYREYTGEWRVISIGLHQDSVDATQTGMFYLQEADIRSRLHARPKFSHKGTYGHALLIAGCHGMMGAAVLASKACLRAGVGLVTTHVPRFGVGIVQTAVPESLISIDESDTVFTLFPDLEKFNAVGVGPAINCRPNAQEGLKALLRSCRVPMVIDADAINILGQRKEWLSLLPENSILTPHPKEFERLAGRFDDPYERNLRQIEFAMKYRVYVVLKGAYTAIACPDGTCWFNSTGNPGMATGGSGDVLTGIILSLLAQSYSPLDAALAGTYIHGLAGDMAAAETGEEALIASDMIGYIGKAFQKLKEKQT